MARTAGTRHRPAAREPSPLLAGSALASIGGRPSPIDIATEICRAAQAGCFTTRGKTYTQTVYTASLSPEDLARFEGRKRELTATLKDTLAWWAKRNGYALPGEPRVRVVADDDLRPGQLSIAAGLRAEEAAKLGRSRRARST